MNLAFLFQFNVDKWRFDYNLGFTFDAVKNLAAGEFGLKGVISFPTYYAQNAELFLFAPKTKLE